MSATALSFFILLIVAIAACIVWFIYHRRYQRASQETAFVRTGYGGLKVVVDGGALVFPVLHEVIPVNMNTLRLDVVRNNNNALITKDRMRMDVQAEFYVRVKHSVEDIAIAAQTLGRRTTNLDSLKNLLEGKFVNALREVAAEMKMDELHQHRADFVQRVKSAVEDGLSKNGLELEAVSLSELDQTDRKYFNPQNAFDAEGLMFLTELIQNRTKQRNAIERDTEVAIQEKDLHAERQKLELAKEEEFARLDQEREIQVRRAEQKTQVTSQQVEKEREAREAEVAARKQVELFQLVADREIEENRITKTQAIKELELSRQQSVDIAEAKQKRESRQNQIEAERIIRLAEIQTEQTLEEARLQKERQVAEHEIEQEKFLGDQRRQKDQFLKERDIDTERILDEARLSAENLVEMQRLEKRKAVEELEIQIDQLLRNLEIEKSKLLEAAEIGRKQEIEIADIARRIILSHKEGEHVAAQTEVDRKRAEAAEAEEKILTVRQVEVAERQKTLDLLQARTLAEREAISIIETAGARLKAAASQAETMGIIAGGEADKIRRVSEAEAEAELNRLRAEEERFKVESSGQRDLNEAENVLSIDKTEARIKRALIENMPEIIRQSVKPIESIEGIKILQVEGLTGRTGGGESGAPSGGGNLADQLVNSALRYRGQAPLVDSVLKEIGLSGGDINRITSSLSETFEKKPDEEKPDKE